MPRQAVAPIPPESLFTIAVRLPAAFLALDVAAWLPKIVVADPGDRLVHQRRRDQRSGFDQLDQRRAEKPGLGTRWQRAFQVFARRYVELGKLGFGRRDERAIGTDHAPVDRRGRIERPAGRSG